jgi:hypothetical protein
MTAHAGFSGRVDAVVRVHLKEVVGGLPAEHSINLRLRVSVEPGDNADRVKELVLAKTAKILRSVKGALESTSGEAAPLTGLAPASAWDEARDQAQTLIQTVQIRMNTIPPCLKHHRFSRSRTPERFGRD